MEVLKEGKLFSDTWYGECAKCKAILSAKSSEIREHICSGYKRESSFARMKCPCCNTAMGITFYPEESIEALIIRNKLSS